MTRRLLALVALLVLAAAVGVVGTGAFLNPGPADELADDSGVFLQPADTPNGERYAEITDEGELFVSLDALPGTTMTADDIFLVGFEGVGDSPDPAEVWVEYDTDRITLRRMDTGDPIEGEADALVLDPEETVQVGVAVDSGRLSGDTVVENITYRANVPTAEEGAFFDVTIDDVTSPVAAGEDVVVDATIENTGDATDTQPIDLLDFDGAPVDGLDALTLAPGESASFTFTWSTDEDDIGTGDVTVTSDDDQDIAPVTVEEPDPEPFFAVTIESATSPVGPGETVSVETIVENTGDATDTQPIDLLDFDGERVDGVDELTLAPGESQRFTFTWVPSEADIGTGTVTATSLDDQDTAPVTVEESPGPPDPEPFFAVTIESATSPVGPGETVSVETIVENIGNGTGTQPIDLLDFDGEPVDGLAELTLAPGESQRFTFTWVPGEADIGTGTVTATSLDDQDTALVTVEEPPGPPGEESVFLVNITDVTDRVQAGEDVLVDATVENVGDATDTQIIELRDFDGNVVDSIQVTLEPGEQTTVQFRWQTSEANIGVGDIRVNSKDDIDLEGGDSAQVSVEESETGLVGFGVLTLPGLGWLLFAVTLTVLTDYLTQTRLRGVLPLLETPRDVRTARMRYALARLGLLWVAVFVAAGIAMWLLVDAGLGTWPVFLVILVASVLLGLVLGRALVPDLDDEYLDSEVDDLDSEDTDLGSEGDT